MREWNLNTELRDVRLVAVDFETTGAVEGYVVEPWQIGLVEVAQGAICPETCFESLMDVGDRPFNPRAPGRHAMVREALRSAPVAQEVFPEVLTRILDRPLVAHNIGTERSVFSRLAPLHRLGPWIDTLALTRHAYPELASKSLEDVTAALGLVGRIGRLCPGRAAHDALYDAVACAVLLEHFLALPGWERVTIGALSGR